jgi:uncharacterized protein YutE (UPF0331/DUF86 family)
MIDTELVIRKITLITKDLHALGPYAQMTLEAYLSDPVNEVAVERYLERVIGRMIDINYHLVTGLGHPPPKDYFESYTELGKLGVLPLEFAKGISRSAGLRNRIVHEYDAVEEEKIHEALQEAMRDIPVYIECVHRFIQTREQTP